MEEKEAIVFDEAFIRKAFKGGAFKKMFSTNNLFKKMFSTLIKLCPTSGYDMDGDGEISTREFKIVMKR